MDDIIASYQAAADSLIARYDAFDCAALYAPVIDLLPLNPVLVADIGAGTGRDAAWFAGQGHAVVAVEPVRAFRDAGARLHPHARISWIDDRLPALAAMPADGNFGLVALNGVWQHIDEPARSVAMPRLGLMLAPGGLLVMALRHGPATEGRRIFDIDADETIAQAGAAGFDLLRRRHVESTQAGNRAMGVVWTWVAFRKRDGY